MDRQGWKIAQVDSKCSKASPRPNWTHISEHILSNSNLETPKRVNGKQCRPRSDAAERGV